MLLLDTNKENMKQESSIVKKLVIYFLLLNIFTVIVVSSYSYYRAKDALVERTFDQLTSLRIEKKYRIERFFEDRIADVNLVSKSKDALSIINLLNANSSDVDPYGKLIYKEYDKFLSKHFFAGKYYKRFFISNADNKVVSFCTSEIDSFNLSFFEVDKVPVAKLFKRIKNDQAITIEDYKIDINTNQPTIFIGSPVTDNHNKLVGYLAIEIDIEAINTIMFDNNQNNGLGKSGESYLVGNDYLMRSTSRFHDNAVFKTIVNTKGVINALKGQTGNEMIKDYRSISVLSSYSKVEIPGLEWAILAEIDEKEAMVPIESIRNNILYLSVLMSLLLFAFVYIIAKRISMPIVKLKYAAQKITKGNYDVFVKDIVSNDEIGSLVDAFNEMSSKIKEQTENLKLERTMHISSMIDGQELERQRLSRELHDGLGQSILAIKMRLERMANASPEKSSEIMKEVQALFVNTINEVRSISNNLMPAVLNELGLIDALANLCRELSNSIGVDINFKHSGLNVDIDDRINTYLYRISQEALNNIIKHSNAKFATIELKSDSGKVYLNISDNGNGFNYSESRKLCGNGISNMKERVFLLGGNIEINSKKGKGTGISISIPLKHD